MHISYKHFGPNFIKKRLKMLQNVWQTDHKKSQWGIGGHVCNNWKHLVWWWELHSQVPLLLSSRTLCLNQPNLVLVLLCVCEWWAAGAGCEGPLRVLVKHQAWYARRILPLKLPMELLHLCNKVMCTEINKWNRHIILLHWHMLTEITLRTATYLLLNSSLVVNLYIWPILPTQLGILLDVLDQ